MIFLPGPQITKTAVLKGNEAVQSLETSDVRGDGSQKHSKDLQSTDFRLGDPEYGRA